LKHSAKIKIYRVTTPSVATANNTERNIRKNRLTDGQAFINTPLLV